MIKSTSKINTKTALTLDGRKLSFKIRLNFLQRLKFAISLLTSGSIDIEHNIDKETDALLIKEWLSYNKFKENIDRLSI
jgi:hypothetical protein